MQLARRAGVRARYIGEWAPSEHELDRKTPIHPRRSEAPQLDLGFEETHWFPVAV